MTDAEQLVEYLKHNRLYDHLMVSAGLAKAEPGVADVHTPGALAKPAAAYLQLDDEDPEKVEEDDPLVINHPGDDEAGYVKRAMEAGDTVFAKGDASLYVSRPLVPGSAQRLNEWATKAGIKNVVPPDLMHVTQVHSAVDVPGLTPKSDLLDVPTAGRYLSPLGDGNALVMHVRVPEMHDRFKEAQAAGAQWSFPHYRPHVTLSYDAGDAVNWQMLDAPDVPLQLGPEKFAGDNPNWVAENGLAKSDDFEFTVDIKKASPERQMIFGWASVTHVDGKLIIDKQDDGIQLADNPADGTQGLESAAYDFSLYSREHGEMHAKRGTGKMIESCVFTPEKAAAGIVAKNEQGQTIYGWWVGFKVDDADTWAKAKDGQLPEFSIGGRSRTTEQI